MREETKDYSNGLGGILLTLQKIRPRSIVWSV